MIKDIFQERYMLHQAKKKKCLMEIIKERHSDRIFSNKVVSENVVSLLISDLKYCPSSCNRKAIELKVIDDKDLKNLLGGILVGGIGWIHRASHIILFFADPLAYKAANEINYMPYLDSGVFAYHLYLVATNLKLKGCFVNPNIREINVDHFKQVFGDKLFCGAFAIGYVE